MSKPTKKFRIRFRVVDDLVEYDIPMEMTKKEINNLIEDIEVQANRAKPQMII